MMTDEALHRLARDVLRQLNSLEDRRTAGLRETRRELSQSIQTLDPAEVMALARVLLQSPSKAPRWFVFELVHHHRPTLEQLDASTLAILGHGMSTWGDVDSFSCYLAGVAWRLGSLHDSDVLGWTESGDRWWRRAALVSTVALNSRARGGEGDAIRTLMVCDRLKTDRDDMVVKALSWSLRELAKRDADAVADYISDNEADLAPRVLREVRNKLETGLKNPRRPQP